MPERWVTAREWLSKFALTVVNTAATSPPAAQLDERGVVGGRAWNLLDACSGIRQTCWRLWDWIRVRRRLGIDEIVGDRLCGENERRRDMPEE